MLAERVGVLPADKGHDADAIRDELAKAVIPAKSNRRIPIGITRALQVRRST